MDLGFIDTVLDSLVSISSLPPVVILMAYPTAVHLAYATIWVSPGVWFPSSAPQRRVRYFGNMAYSKTTLFYCMLPWYLGLLDSGLRAQPYWWRLFAKALSQPLPVLLLGVVMISVGVMLEITSFNAIGESAILYGCKFGVEVEWVEGVFPYTWTAHPQHFGVLLTFGSWLAFCSDLFQGVLFVVLWWYALYGFQTIVEGYFGQEEHDKLKAKSSSKKR